jgi:hypothetical protein
VASLIIIIIIIIIFDYHLLAEQNCRLNAHLGTPQLNSVGYSSQSESHIATDGQSVSKS